MPLQKHFSLYYAGTAKLLPQRTRTNLVYLGSSYQDHQSHHQTTHDISPALHQPQLYTLQHQLYHSDLQ